MRITTCLLDLSRCVTDAADLVSPAVVDHHRRTAYLTEQIGRAMGLDADILGRAVLAAALHDIGAFSLGERLRALDFDRHLLEHAESGYRLLREFDPFAEVAPIVQHHHLDWEFGRGAEYEGEPVPREAALVYLADRVAVLFRVGRDPLAQRTAIVCAIRAAEGERFHPEVVAAFVAVARSDSFWFGLAEGVTPLEPGHGCDLPVGAAMEIDAEAFASMLAHIVDFRSHFTATHSCATAAVTDVLAGQLGVSPATRHELRVAGLLHDLGKLGVPKEILEKPGPLTVTERQVVDAHSYHSGRILRTIPELRRVADWVAHHHERMDGSGYPDRLAAADLGLETRVIAVADIFTALTEDRPYREGLDRRGVLRAMNEMVVQGHIDPVVVDVLGDVVEDVSCAVDSAQEMALAARDAVLATPVC